jgi:hypothetical protein
MVGGSFRCPNHGLWESQSVYENDTALALDKAQERIKALEAENAKLKGDAL